MRRIFAFITTIVTSALLVGSLNVVSAQYVPCPGPYGICIPKTDIVIGSVVIESETLYILVILFCIGLLMIGVARLLQAELAEIANKD
jgi:hypothetical protein